MSLVDFVSLNNNNNNIIIIVTIVIIVPYLFIKDYYYTIYNNYNHTNYKWNKIVIFIIFVRKR